MPWQSPACLVVPDHKTSDTQTKLGQCDPCKRKANGSVRTLVGAQPAFTANPGNCLTKQVKGLRWAGAASIREAGGWGLKKIGEELGYYISSLILHLGCCLFLLEREREKSMHSDSIISHGASLGARGALGGDIPGHGSLHSFPPPPSSERIHWNFTTFACFCENTHLCLRQTANGGWRGLWIPPTFGARYGMECAVNNASVKLSCEGAK